MPGSSTARCPRRGSPRRSTRRGGAVIHTHPLTPPHQMHWMGAAEVLSDAVLGRCADALDLDGQASELLWFAVLNLGNRVAASSYTDCALGRQEHALAGRPPGVLPGRGADLPGDRRGDPPGPHLRHQRRPALPLRHDRRQGAGRDDRAGRGPPPRGAGRGPLPLPAQVGPALPAGRARRGVRGRREDAARSSWRRPSASGPASGPGTSCGSRTSGATGPSPARSTSSRRGRRPARSPRP